MGILGGNKSMDGDHARKVEISRPGDDHTRRAGISKTKPTKFLKVRELVEKDRHPVE